MKIAIASDNNKVSGHFGHCEGFTVYKVESNLLVDSSFTPNPGHKPGYLPVFLRELGANVIIAGGMGETAQALFVEQGIEVVVGATGDCDQVATQYISGNLQSTGSICREHQHEGHCND